MAKADDPEFIASLIDTEALYQHAPCGYFSFLPDGKIIKINQTLLTWIGQPREAVEQKLIFNDLMSRGGKIYYELFYLPSIQLQDTVNEVNFEVKKNDGSTFPALLNAIGIKDEEGRLIAINVTVYDITDRKKYEAELLHAKKDADLQKAGFEFLSDYIPEMIWMADAAGKITYANHRFLDYFNLSKNQLTEEIIYDKIHPDDLGDFIAAWRIAVKSSQPFEIQLRVINSAARYEWFRIRAIPFLEEKTVSKWLGSWSNIDVHVNELMRRDDFLSIASHELKTPLTSLKAALQLLNRIKEKPNSPMHISLIEQSVRSMDKINGLIDDLLNVRRLKEGQLQLNETIFSVAEMLEQSCTHIKLAGKVELVIDADPDLMVMADEHRIDQVVVNFVNNAVKYAPESKQIFLSAARVNNMVKVTVRDTGPGIPREKHLHLFDRYYRADHSGADYSGLGLGLYICAETIRRHDGKIGVDSIPGEGSSFWFMLPEYKAGND